MILEREELGNLHLQEAKMDAVTNSHAMDYCLAVYHKKCRQERPWEKDMERLIRCKLLPNPRRVGVFRVSHSVCYIVLTVSIRRSGASPVCRRYDICTWQIPTHQHPRAVLFIKQKLPVILVVQKP